MNAHPAMFKLPPQSYNEHFRISLLAYSWERYECATAITIGDAQIKRQESPIVVHRDLLIVPGRSDLDAIENWMALNTGDYSEFIDYEIVHFEQRAETGESVEGWRRRTIWDRETTIRPWTNEEMYFRFHDAMFPPED